MPRDIYLDTEIFDLAMSEDDLQPGRSIATWLREGMKDLPFTLSEPIGEDYGWGFWAEKDGESYWFAISFVEGDEATGRASWVASVQREVGLRFWKLLGAHSDADRLLLEERMVRLFEETEGIRVTSTSP